MTQARAFANLAEGFLVTGLVLAPWYYGCAPDSARYALTTLLLVSAACAAAGGLAWRGPLLLPALCLLLVGVVQLVVGSSVAPIWTLESLLLLTSMLGALLFVHDRARDRRAAWRLAAAVLTVVFAQAAFGVYSWSVAPTQIYGKGRADITMPFGSFVNHNHFAGFVEMGGVLALGLAIGHARRARSLAASVGLGGLTLAIAAAHIASRSRGGLLAFAGGLTICAALGAGLWRGSGSSSQGLQRALLAGGAAALILGFGLAAVSSQARRHLATLLLGEGGSSGSYRIDMARATLRLAAAHPLLGSGLGSYEDAVTAFKRGHGDVRATHAESDVLELLAESGLAGAFAAGWLGMAVLGCFGARLTLGHDPLRKGLAIGALGGAAALVLHSFLDFNLRLPSNALLFVVLLGLASAPRQDAATPRPLAHPLLVAGALAALAVAAAWRTAGALSLTASLSVSDPNGRIGRLDTTLRMHPYLAEARRARGLAWRELASGRSRLDPLRLERSLEDLDAALRLRPLWAQAWADRAWVHAMRGDLGEARAGLDEAIRLDPTHPGIDRVRAELGRRARK